MKRYLIVIITLFTAFSFGQKKWSLEECVYHALENNITVLQGENSILSNEQDIMAAKGNFYPSLSANINQGLSLGNVELFQGQFVDRTANTTNIGLNVNQTVFNGFQNTNIYKQAQLQLETSQMELNRIKDDISLFVANAYLNVLFNKENLEIAKAQLVFSEKNLEQVRGLVDAGVQPVANIYDAEATLANDEQNVTVAENNYTLALLSLSQLLQVSFDGFDVQIIEIDQPSAELMYNDVKPILEAAYGRRYEIKVAELNIENSKLNTELSKAGFLPRVTFGYGFGSNAFFTNLTADEAGFFQQLDDQKSHQFNLNVNIPIFSRFLNKTNVAKSKIAEESSKLSLEQARLTLESNIQQAFTDAQAAFKTFEAAKKSLASQELAFENSQERYNIGVMNTFDFEQSRFRLVNAQSSLVNAKYDFVFKTKVLDFYLGKPIRLD
ncbi:MAG: TolC family protein [Bacteroidia bacterium]|nr:TolC family protein [Bacteroidia bacterium]MBT8270222.1 TolC family protein [Bacteroidia bacterium]NNF82549.1 TolC family protein [Flavobacteriaceae bacterium]NNK71065.1 TolC family protein [Flavobacteriaceae bacterium]NNL78865.1 TolC family protein [Flavobacteriaceae bacterium]